MRIFSTGVALLLMCAGVAQAQPSYPLMVQLGVYSVTPDGGEKARGMWRSTGAVLMNKTVVSTFLFGPRCDQWTLSGAWANPPANATTVWHIEMTPTRVVDDAVTFNLRVVRVDSIKQQLADLAAQGSLRPVTQEIELTLRPGESWPVDRVSVPPGAKTIHGQPCGNGEVIRVMVDHYPPDGEELRLVGAELWLVERLPNGTEAQRSQPISMRGLPARPMEFYFDSITDDKVTLDIYGTLTAGPGADSLAVEIQTRSRLTPGSPGVRGPHRFFESTIQVKPSETVEVRLPAMGEQAGPFASREFSIRIRARQLR